MSLAPFLSSARRCQAGNLISRDSNAGTEGDLRVTSSNFKQEIRGTLVFMLNLIKATSLRVWKLASVTVTVLIGVPYLANFPSSPLYVCVCTCVTCGHFSDELGASCYT